MSWLRQILFQLRGFFRRRQLEREMSDEFRLHLELRRERNAATGMTAAEASIAAQRAFGGIEQVKERCRD
jgi:hypothetical protein